MQSALFVPNYTHTLDNINRGTGPAVRFPCDRQGWKMLVPQRRAMSPCFHQHIQCSVGLGNIHIYILIQICVCGVASAMHSIITLYTGCVIPQHCLPAGLRFCMALASPLPSSGASPVAKHCKAPAPLWHLPRRQARRQSGCSQGKGISQACGLLPSARPQCGGKHFFSPTALRGPGGAAGRGAPSVSP